MTRRWRGADENKLPRGQPLQRRGVARPVYWVRGYIDACACIIPRSAKSLWCALLVGYWRRCRSKHAAFLNEFAKTQMFAVYCEAYQPADQAEPDLRGAEDNIEGGKPVAIE